MYCVCVYECSPSQCLARVGSAAILEMSEEHQAAAATLTADVCPHPPSLIGSCALVLARLMRSALHGGGGGFCVGVRMASLVCDMLSSND